MAGTLNVPQTKVHYFGDKIVPTCRKSAYDKIDGAHSNFYTEHVFDGLSSPALLSMRSDWSRGVFA